MPAYVFYYSRTCFAEGFPYCPQTTSCAFEKRKSRTFPNNDALQQQLPIIKNKEKLFHLMPQSNIFGYA